MALGIGLLITTVIFFLLGLYVSMEKNFHGVWIILVPSICLFGFGSIINFRDASIKRKTAITYIEVPLEENLQVFDEFEQLLQPKTQIIETNLPKERWHSDKEWME